MFSRKEAIRSLISYIACYNFVRLLCPHASYKGLHSFEAVEAANS